MGIQQSTVTLASFYQSLGFIKMLLFYCVMVRGRHRRFEKSDNPVEE